MGKILISLDFETEKKFREIAENSMIIKGVLSASLGSRPSVTGSFVMIPSSGFGHLRISIIF